MKSRFHLLDVVLAAAIAVIFAVPAAHADSMDEVVVAHRGSENVEICRRYIACLSVRGAKPCRHPGCRFSLDEGWFGWRPRWAP